MPVYANIAFFSDPSLQQPPCLAHVSSVLHGDMAVFGVCQNFVFRRILRDGLFD